MNAYHHWSAHDWIAHYGGQRAAVGGTWDAHGRRLPAQAPPPPPMGHATGQLAQRAQQAFDRGQQSLQGAAHGVTSLAHEGLQTATSPKVLLAGLAALGILGWVVIQSGRTVGRTVEGVAPHAVKALPFLI